MCDETPVIASGSEVSGKGQKEDAMNKKKTKKSKAAKSIKDLPEKTVSAKDAKNVKGGELSLNYGKIKYDY